MKLSIKIIISRIKFSYFAHFAPPFPIFHSISHSIISVHIVMISAFTNVINTLRYTFG